MNNKTFTPLSLVTLDTVVGGQATDAHGVPTDPNLVPIQSPYGATSVEIGGKTFTANDWNGGIYVPRKLITNKNGVVQPPAGYMEIVAPGTGHPFQRD